MKGRGKAGNRVGEAGRSVHSDAGLPSDAAVRIGHMDGSLFVASVDHADVGVGHHVEGGQYVVPRQQEDVLDAFAL